MYTQRHYTDPQVIQEMADCIDAMATALDVDVHEVLNDYIAERNIDPEYVSALCEYFMPESETAGFMRRIK
jgi:hypothetical protein